MPRYQGELDGLCGMYAIVNAFDICGFDDGDGLEEIFRAACAGIGQSRWPQVLWDGTSFHDVMNMIAHCRAVVDGADGIVASYPFLRETPRSNEDYWRRFDALFEERPAIHCAIMGLTRPEHHWIVAAREPGSRRIDFTDSDPHEPSRRRNRASLYAGVSAR